MKPIDLAELLNDLPDEMIVPAAKPARTKPRRLQYFITSAAACLLVLIAAAVYPKLRVQKPGTIPEPETQITATDTTAADPALSAEQTAPQTVSRPEQTGTASVTAVTTLSAEQTVTASLSAEHTETTPSVSGTVQTAAGSTQITTGAGTSSRTETETDDRPVGPEIWTSSTQTSPSDATQTSPSETAGTSTQRTSSSECETTIVWETTALVEGNGVGHPMPVQCRVLSRGYLNADPQHMSKEIEATFIRDRLPAGFSSDELPGIDFTTQDYLLIRAQTVGSSGGLADVLSALGRRYSLSVVLPSVPQGEVCEMQLVVILPREVLDAGGFSQWQHLQRPYPAKDEPQCFLKTMF